MIANDQEFQGIFARIERFQRQLAYLQQVEKNPANYRASASGFLAEIESTNSRSQEEMIAALSKAARLELSLS